MNTEILVASITGLASIVVAVIEIRAKRDRDRNEVRAARREQEMRLAIDLMLATSEMADVLCIALQGGQINGNVEKARAEGRNAREAYRSFLREQAAHQVAKL